MKSPIKLFIILAFLWTFTAFHAVGQTNVIITMIDDSEVSSVVYENGKLFFSENHLVIEEGNDNFEHYSFPLSNIKKVKFVSQQTSIQSQSNDNAYRLYPNPAHQSFRIMGATDNNFEIHLYALDGRLLIHKTINADDAIDVSNLANGFYIVKVNEQAYKFCKQ